MKKILTASILAFSFAVSSLSAQAEEGGCLKYGAAGAVAGHFVGNHHVVGALGGCTVGAYKRHKARKLEAAKAKAYDAEQQQKQKVQGVMQTPSNQTTKTIISP